MNKISFSSKIGSSTSERRMPSATLVDPAEPGIHHPCTFSVYNATHNGVTIEFKVKNNENKNVYTMRIK